MAGIESPEVPSAGDTDSGSNQTIVKSDDTSVDASESQAEGAEHPDAPKIRRQVEFYFSDENLPTDLHLLRCCGGSENLPVSINRIRGFKRMKGFKPRSLVVDALRQSNFLEVTPDGKQVKRKVPFVGKCLLDKDYHGDDASDDEIAYDPRTRHETACPITLLNQKKVELPPGMTKGMMKPTGFEDGFTDEPISPQEAQEDEAMYDPDKPFVERIEIAIQKFKSKRRMHQMYASVFTEFMKFGGVDSGPRMFGGLSQQDMTNMNSEEIARAQATHHVQWDRGDKKNWEVDFLGVGEAFLSSWFPTHYGYNLGQIKNACKVLRSFYNYLLSHNVCLEHNPQLLMARALCDKAENELPQAHEAGLALPGPFNVAASTIFGGSHAGSYAGASSWTADLDEEELKNTEGIGMRMEQAMVTFKTGVAVCGTDEQYDDLLKSGPCLSLMKVVKSESLDLEVISIHGSTSEAQAAYAAQNIHYKDKLTLQPLGIIKCRTLYVSSDREYDLPPGISTPSPLTPTDKEYEFWVEDSILQECFVSMKISATALTLQGGIVILDEVKEVMCSFYNSITNELWANRGVLKFKLLRTGLEDVIGNYLDEDDEEAGEKMGDEEMSDDFEE